MKGAIEVRDAFNRLIRVKEHRRVRSIDLTRICRARSRPLADGCALEKLILWSAHRSAMGLNLEKALLCLTSLQVNIKKARDKLLKISKICTSCNRRRALCGRQDHLIKVSEKAPSDIALKPFLFPQAKSTHVIDVLGPIRLHTSF